MIPSQETVTDESVIDEVSAVLASFVRVTDALTRAIHERDGAAMCDAVEALARDAFA